MFPDRPDAERRKQTSPRRAWERAIASVCPIRIATNSTGWALRTAKLPLSRFPTSVRTKSTPLQNLDDPHILLENPVNNSRCRQFIAKVPDPMGAYFLVRQSVPLAHAILAAMARNDVPELAVWLADSAEPNCCQLSDEEFERAKSYERAIVLSSQFQKGKEIAIVFGPRDEWPQEFSQFRDYFAEIDGREAERKHITEEIWLGCDTRPNDLANFSLPHLSTRKTRLFTIACCELVIDKMVDPRSRTAVQVARKYVNGIANQQELNVAFQEAYEAVISVMVNGRREPRRRRSGHPRTRSSRSDEPRRSPPRANTRLGNTRRK